MAEDKFIKKIIVLAFIGTLFLIGVIMLKPIIISIIFGLLLAYIFNPVYKKISRRFKNENLSAFLLIAGIILIIAIPIFLLTPVLIKQTFETYRELQGVDFIEPIRGFIPSFFTEEFALQASASINSLVSNAFSSLLNQFVKLVANIPNLALQLAVMFFTFYFGVRDSKKLKDYISSLSPFSPQTEKKFMREFRSITDSIIYGQFIIGVSQGLALGLGLLIIGFDKVLILTVLAIIASMIPMLGSWLIWVPVAILLFLSGHPIKGTFLVIYGALFVSTLDNFLRPYLLSKKSDLPISIALIGIIGGLYTFGIAGIIIGPLILAYILIIMDFYMHGKLGELLKQ